MQSTVYVSCEVGMETGSNEPSRSRYYNFNLNLIVVGETGGNTLTTCRETKQSQNENVSLYLIFSFCDKKTIYLPEREETRFRIG